MELRFLYSIASQFLHNNLISNEPAQNQNVAANLAHSMPSPYIGIDGLWNCLRPAFSISSPRNSYRLFNSLRTFTKFCRKPLQCPHQAKKRIFQQIRPFGREVAVTKGWLRPNQLSAVERLYYELNRQGSKTDFLWVYETVGELIRQHGEAPNRRLFLALILANTNAAHGSITEVMRLLQEMAENGIQPDAAIYHAVLKVYVETVALDVKAHGSSQVLAIHPDYLIRTKVLEEMRQRWFSISNDGWHDLIAGLLRDRQIELALDTFDFIRKEGISTQSWLQDMIVYILCDIEEFDEVLAIMRRRASAGDLTISPTLWVYILDTASRSLHHSATLYVWRKRVETFYLNPPSGMCINILSTAARHGDFRLASDVCRILGNRRETLQLYHYESLLESYTVASDLKTALTILSVMTSAGVPPSASSVRPVYALLRQTPSLLPSAVPILHQLHEMERPVPVTVVNVIIEAFVAHHDLDSAVETYKTLHLLCPTGPVTATFNELFRGCWQAARKDIAMFLASEMVALNIVPDLLTYDRLILVCLRAATNGAKDAYDDAWRYFEEMRGLSWWPRRKTTLELLQAGSEKGDKRVWSLANDEGTTTGISMAELEPLARQCWENSEEHGRRKAKLAEADEGMDLQYRIE